MNTLQKIAQASKTSNKLPYIVDRWKPLPQDLLLRRWVLHMVKGSLTKRVSPVQWQRALRTEDASREKKVHAMMKKKNFRDFQKIDGLVLMKEPDLGM